VALPQPAAEAWVRQLRRPPETLHGRCLWDEFPALLERADYRAAREAAREGRPHAFEVTTEGAAGSGTSRRACCRSRAAS
jgi:hypothetical protein